MSNTQPKPWGDVEHLPQGARPQADGSVLWRVWAPRTEKLRLALWPGGRRVEHVMHAEPGGYFTHREPNAGEGTRYAYVFPDGVERPDPASLWQPDGVHRPSALFFPESFPWSDKYWRGAARSDLVIYELHVGTFTAEGTFAAVAGRLKELGELGITAIELMPVAQFPGEHNWGYDGVYWCAAQNSYGGPRELQRLVDAAHQAGLAVILDVVYNHLGPEGNYLSAFGPYSTEKYHTPWGAAMNYDGPDCDAVRRLAIDNACRWVRDFHVDGLRLDAVHSILDLSARHILADIQASVQEEARRRGRVVLVIAESNQNDMRLLNPPDRGGHGLDGVWADDFHHSVHALLTGERTGYYLDFGRLEHLSKAYTDVFVYDGVYSPFRRRRHGSRVGDAERERFVVCTQNHDQIGNRPWGDRLSTLCPPAAQRLTCGLLLLSPCVPLIFMGQEYGETNPFPFFCSFGDAELVAAVHQGRRAEFPEFADQEMPDPQDFATFQRAILAWHWEDSLRGGLRRLYADLLAARRRWPPLVERRQVRAQVFDCGANSSSRPRQGVLVLQRGAEPSLLVFANIGPGGLTRPDVELGPRTLLLSTEDDRYGGERQNHHAAGVLRPFELLIYGLPKWGC